MLTEKIWRGVELLLDAYVGLRSDDFVVLLYTSDSHEAAIWVSAALEMRCARFSRVSMAPLHDPQFPAKLRVALPPLERLTGRLIILSFERDTMSHTSTLNAVLAPYMPDRCAVFRAISTSDELFADAMSVSPQELSARNTSILERCMRNRKFRITTGGGTNLDVRIDSDRHRWISNRGMSKPGGTVVLPAGEVATFPASISGVFVADFAFNVNAITGRDARLGRFPVTVTIENGQATDYFCEDVSTMAFLRDCFERPYARNVGELGFGTNYGVSEAIAMNSHINERRPGVHIGFGQHNQDPGVVNYQCDLHLDLIAKGGTIWADENADSLDLEQFTPSANPHPLTPRDEDVFSPDSEIAAGGDCCGILQDDGLRLCEIKL